MNPIDEPNINADLIVKHWIETSDGDFATMEALLAAKQNSWALFLGHLVLEKLLKAYYVKQHSRQAPLWHDLVRIAQRGEIVLTDEQIKWLDVITQFNINARYDDYKRRFSARCTTEYTAEWSEKIKQLRVWIKERL
jgi:HEPN domain-containing protein